LLVKLILFVIEAFTIFVSVATIKLLLILFIALLVIPGKICPNVFEFVIDDKLVLCNVFCANCFCFKKYLKINLIYFKLLIFLFTNDLGKLFGGIDETEILSELSNEVGIEFKKLGSLVCDNKFAITVAFLEAAIYYFSH